MQELLEAPARFNKNVNTVCDSSPVSGKFSFHYDDAGPGCFPAIVPELIRCDGTSGPVPSSVPMNQSGRDAALAMSHLWASIAQDIEAICAPDTL